MNFHPVSRSTLTVLLAFTFAFVAAAEEELRSFGVVGDGKVDDSAAIQKAVDSSPGAVRFSKGVYRLTKTVVIDLDKVGFTSLVGDGTARIVMAGPGPAFKFIGTHEGSADPHQFKPNVWERQRSPMVDGLEIVGAHPEADGIEAAGTMQLTVTRTVIREARHGIHLSVRNRNVLIADCHIYHNRGIGVFYDNVNLHQSNISGSHISYNAGGGVVSRGGNVRNLHIGTCDIESNMATNTPPTANVLLDSAGGSIGEVAITGCTIQHNNPSPDSANIRILGAGTEPTFTRRTGETSTQEGHVTITGNVLSDVQVNIHLKNARGVTITGNTLWEGYAHDLLIESCNNIIVGPNNFDRNPRYGAYPQRDSKLGVVFRDSRDCTLTGVQIFGVRGRPAALHLERCDRFNIAGCTILDSDGVGLLLDEITRSRVSGCMIRDDRKERNAAPSIRVTGGKGNWISGNWLANGIEADTKSNRVEGNHEKP
ncbi:MAG: right-handed parallel beta-helix repeat-containing protein [Verrucomicrobia bacterium]|nr:right-handed parallel beta-helix repeat-containing protein [Verrucomicrobiota bacterium]